MGAPKATLEVGGDRLLGGLVGDALRAAGAERVLMVGVDGSVARALDLEYVADLWPGQGPLAGLATALLSAGMGVDSKVDVEVVLVAACDQPTLGPDLLRRLVVALRGAPEPVAGAAPVTADGRRHPFPSAWRPSVGPAIARLVEDGIHRADAAFTVAEVVDVPAALADLVDLDTPEDLQRWLAEQER